MTWRPLAVAALTGIGVWCGISVVSGEPEAWDSPLYWRLGYPLLLALGCALAWRFRRHWSGMAFALMLAQLLPLVIVGLVLGRSFALLPIGVALFSLLSLPLLVAMGLVAWARGRRRASSDP
jgi:hypothetical protein